MQVKDKAAYGFTQETFYTLQTNSLGSLEATLSGDTSRSQPKIHPINPSAGNLNSSPLALAYLFEPEKEQIWISKKDSGSAFTIFGVIPYSVLSMYNGEPTSEGASVIVLPEPSSEEISQGSGKSGGC